MKNIFEKTWIWVANESELPSPGSFKSTYVGRNPVIATRDRTGKSNGFTFPYHAWSYGLDGKLRGIPYPQGYEGVIKKEEMSLQKLRTESNRGSSSRHSMPMQRRSRSSSATLGCG